MTWPGVELSAKSRIAVVSLFGLLCVVLLWSRWRLEPDPGPGSADELVFAPEIREQIRSVELGRPDQTPIVLARQGDAWLLPEWGNFPVEPVYAKMLSDVLFSMKRGDIVAEDPDQYSLFQLDERARTITLRDGNGLALGKLFVGKPGEGYRSAFIRINGETEVRLVSADLIPAISRAGWGDRTVWRVPEKLIDAFVFKQGPRSIHLVRSPDGLWQDSGQGSRAPAQAFPADTLPVLAHPRAGHVSYHRNTGQGFEELAYIRISAGGAELSLRLGEPQDGFVPAIRPGLPVVYHMPLAWLERIRQAVTDPPD